MCLVYCHIGLMEHLSALATVWDMINVELTGPYQARTLPNHSPGKSIPGNALNVMTQDTTGQ